MLWGVASRAVNSVDSDAVCQIFNAGMFRDAKAQTSRTVKERIPKIRTALTIQARARLIRFR